MNPTISFDTRQFQTALRQVYAHTTKTLPQVLNQRAYNVAGRTMDLMKPAPGAEQATRGKIKAYLTQQLGISRHLRTKTGKKGKKLAAKNKQLKRVNLIIQARRHKMGLPGLRGPAMSEAEERFRRAAQVGVGFLKMPFIRIVQSLSLYVPKKRMKILTRWGAISQDPTGKWGAKGTVDPAKPGTWNPKVIMRMLWNVKGAPTKVDRLTRPFLQRAFDLEAREMMDHVRDEMQKGADKVNAGHGHH